ncbi:MAG: CHASE2 domain-containing protein [Nitrospirae bacterium]|nr:CHASE2 domain-containing protein [Nitrospirota bacterium]
MDKKPFKISDWGVGVMLSVLVLVAFFTQWYPFMYMEYVTYDFREGLRHRTGADSVAIIAVDDDCIEKIGHWPPQRALMTQAINRLKDDGASVIGINIIYKDDDEGEKLSVIKELQARIEKDPGSLTDKRITDIYNVIKEAGQGIKGETNLAKTFQSANNIVLPIHFSFDSHLSGQKSVGTANTIPEFLQKNSIDSPPHPKYAKARHIHTPQIGLSSSALAVGHVNVIADRDGVVRREPLFVQYRDRLYPSFALQLALKHKKLNLKELSLTAAKKGLKIGTFNIPINDTGDMLISYKGRYGSYIYYDFLDLVNNKLQGGVFKDKVVIIGSIAEGTASLAKTPVDKNLPYVEIAANVVDNIINDNHISRPNWAFYLDILILLFLGGYLSYIEPRLKRRLSVFIGVAALATINITGIYLLYAHGYWIMTAYPTTLLLMGYSIAAIRYYLQSYRRINLIEEEDTETNKMLGLSFQGQGLLDLAFEKFSKCPIIDNSVKELLYNLGVDYEKKRMQDKALAVYEYVLSSGPYKDLNDRVKKVRTSGETVIIDSAKKDSTVIFNNKAEGMYVFKLGRYEIYKELGRGAMGIVYHSRDPEINRDVALKTLDYAEVDEDVKEEVEGRFRREAEAAGKLFHPNIVKIFDVGTHVENNKEIAYIAMEFLDGTDLAAFCTKDKRLHPRDVIKTIITVADALDYAHSKGVVHRDIKPANIMMLTNKEIRVTDFGVARIMESPKTQTGMVIGTPSYMSPEQIAGKKVDGRSDLFSLGIVFYELLVCEKPFKGDNRIATIMYNITSSPAPNIKDVDPKVPTCIANIINKLLAKNADQRYQTGKELIEAINDCKRLIKQRAAQSANKQK